jgi:hypothetical protein
MTTQRELETTVGAGAFETLTQDEVDRLLEELEEQDPVLVRLGVQPGPQRPSSPPVGSLATSALLAPPATLLRPRPHPAAGLRYWDVIPPGMLDAGCWLWNGYRDKDGYGRHGTGLAHRWVWQQLVGPIQPGLELDHLCLVRPCVNPDHLEPVTREENERRKWALWTGVQKCRRGHDVSERRLLKSGATYCRLCDHIRRAEYRARQKVLKASAPRHHDSGLPRTGRASGAGTGQDPQPQDEESAA